MGTSTVGSLLQASLKASHLGGSTTDDHVAPVAGTHTVAHAAIPVLVSTVETLVIQLCNSLPPARMRALPP